MFFFKGIMIITVLCTTLCLCVQTLKGGLCLNWNKIKTEYITDEASSYRKLAKKYNVSYTAISNRAQAENWVELRNQYNIKTTSKSIEATIDEQVKRATRLKTVADKLLAKIEAAVDDANMQEILKSKQALKQLTGALKDIKEIQMIRSEADIREQNARISALERQAEKTDQTTQTINVVFEANEEYGK